MFVTEEQILHYLQEQKDAELNRTASKIARALLGTKATFKMIDPLLHDMEKRKQIEHYMLPGSTRALWRLSLL